MMCRFFTIVFLFCLLFGTTKTQVFAQSVSSSSAQSRTASSSATPQATLQPRPDTALNITLSPVSLFFETDPGVAIDNEIKIRNNSTSTEQLQITLGTFTADSTGQRPKLLDPKPDDEFMKWLEITKDPFEIQPGEWKTIPLTFSPPQEAALSYYYTIIVSRAQKPGAVGGQTAIEGNPSILTLATVRSPYAKRELQLVEFKAKYPIVEFLPQEFVIKVKNSGNIHMVPSGNIFIDGQGKKDLAVLLANPNRNAILPESQREYTSPWDDGFPVNIIKEVDGKQIKNEKGEQEYTLKWDFGKADRFRFGKYTAHLLMVYDNGERDIPIESFVSFWVIPWKILIVIFIVSLFVLVGLGSLVYVIVRLVKRSRQARVTPVRMQE